MSNPSEDILKKISGGWGYSSPYDAKFTERQIDKPTPAPLQAPLVSTFAAIRCLAVQIADLVQRLSEVGEENGKLKLRIVDAENRAQNALDAEDRAATAERHAANANKELETLRMKYINLLEDKKRNKPKSKT